MPGNRAYRVVQRVEGATCAFHTEVAHGLRRTASTTALRRTVAKRSTVRGATGFLRRRTAEGARLQTRDRRADRKGRPLGRARRSTHRVRARGVRGAGDTGLYRDPCAESPLPEAVTARKTEV